MFSVARRPALILVLLALTLLMGTGLPPQAADLPAAQRSAPSHWAAGPSLLIARAGSCSAQLPDGRSVVTGGAGADGALASVEVLGLQGRFTAASPMLNARQDHLCVALATGMVLAAGGTGPGGDTNAAELYNPVTDTWTAVGGMTAARVHATATLLKDGRVLIAGGHVGGMANKSLETFDPKTGMFTGVTATLSSARQGHAAAGLRDGRVLIAGGSDGNAALATVDIFDPATGKVSAARQLSTPRQGLSATTLLTGDVLFAGGNDGTKDLDTAEVYDAKTGVLGAPIQMGSARSGHTATSLPNNNTILIAGGTSAGVPLTAAELYVPWQGRFKPAGTLAQARTGAAAIPLARAAGLAGRSAKSAKTGTMMIAGGQTGDGVTGSTEDVPYPTLTSDKTQYYVGDTITLTGTGWAPNEAVTMILTVDPVTHDPVTLTSTADANGNFTNSQYVDQPSDLNVTFYVTATGATGDTAAVLTFMDPGNANDGDGAMAVSPAGVYASSTGNTFSFTFTNTGGGPFPSGSYITVTVPSGWTTPTTSAGPGQVSTTAGTCTPSTLSVSTNVIKVLQTCVSGTYFTVNYASVTAPATTGNATFTAVSYDGSGTALTLTSGSPVVVVESAGAIPVVGSPTAANVANGTTLTISAPSGLAVNDLMIANIQTRGGTTAQYPSLTGWNAAITNSTVNFENAGAEHRAVLLYKVATSGDVSAGSFAFSLGTGGTGGAAGAIVAFRGATFDIVPTSWSIGNSTTATAATITTASAGDVVAMFVATFENTAISSFSTTSPGALAPLYGPATNANGGVGAGWDVQSVAGATGSGTATLGSSHDWAAVLLSLKKSQTTPVFSNLSAPTITYGTATTTVSGNITSGATGNVNITINGVQQAAPISSGAFTSTFTTNLLAVSGSPYTITYAYPGDTNYTAISNTSNVLTVSTAALSITANNDSKTYGQTKTYGAGSSAFTPSGLQNSETIGSVTITDTNSGGLATAAAGGSYALTPSAATGGTFTAGNYAITYHAGTLTVNTAALDITANNDSKTYGTLKTYGAGSTAFSTGAGQLKNSDGVTSVTITDTNSGGPVTAAAGGSYPLTPSAAVGTGLSNYAITYHAGTLTVNTAALDITANNDSKTYGTLKTYGAGSTAFSTGAGQLKNSDGVTSVTITDTNSGGPVTAAAGGSYPLTPSAAVGTGLSNYAITYHAGTLTVNTAALDITANNDSKTYGTLKTYGAGSTAFSTGAGQLKNSDGVTSVTITDTNSGGPVTAAAGGSYPLTPSAAVGTGLSNYAITYHAGTLTVNQAPSTVTVTCPLTSQTFTGSPITPCTAAATGAGNLNVPLTVIYTNNTNPGLAGASATYAGDPNHTGNSNTGSFTISQAGQTIAFSFASLPHQYYTTGATVNASSYVTGQGASGNPVTFTVASGPCTYGGTNGATITLKGAGICVINANQAGNGNYSAANQVQSGFLIDSTLLATASSTRVALSWNIYSNATGYTVYQAGPFVAVQTAASCATQSYTSVATPSNNSYIATGLTNGQYYCFDVTASGPGLTGSTQSKYAAAKPAGLTLP